MAPRAPLTISEAAFEAWCSRRGLKVVRIRESQTSGQKRPDYALPLHPRWCIVEIKELDATPDDVSLLQEAQAGTGVRWIDPGARLCRPLRAASDQLRKFSKRGFPMVVCFFDTTASFHLERPHVLQAMFGRETVHVALPDRIHDDILRMPMQYLSLIGDMGSMLSGGQKQRILLARALYREPKILILDEGTANIDPDTEESIAELVAALPVTRIVVAHRAALLARAGRVLLLRNGRLEEGALAKLPAEV